MSKFSTSEATRTQQIQALLERGHLRGEEIISFTDKGMPVVRGANGAGRIASRGLSLIERFWENVDRNGPIPEGREFLGPCWLWTGAMSRSGYRKVQYGSINEGSLDGGNWRRTWRAPKLALLFNSALVDVPPDPDELLIPWLRRANRFYRDQGLEASHRCDNSECVRLDHLEWETHAQNIFNQRTRDGMIDPRTRTYRGPYYDPGD